MSLHVPLDTARTVTTPSGTMVTLASPTTTPAMDVAVWRTELPGGVAGPRHTIDGDQFVVVVSGTLTVEVDNTSYELDAGGCIKLPTGATRVIAAAPAGPAITLTVGRPGAMARVGDADPVPVPWTA